MNKTFASIVIAALLTGSALAGTETEATNTSETTTLARPPIVKPVSPFQNPRFQHPGLELAFKGQEIQVGAKGEAVARVQQALIDMGFGLPAGATGYYGQQTRSALQAFQSSRGIGLTGKIDAATLRSLDKVSPAPGKRVWQDQRSASLAVPKAPLLSGKMARAVVDLSEHRITVYQSNGEVERVYPVASGAPGTSTDLGVKVVYDRVADPTPIAWALWPESRGGAFGTRMLDLSWYDPASGQSWGSGEELHGTYARDSIGSNASHGCVRMQNEDVEWVYQNLKRGDMIIVQR